MALSPATKKIPAGLLMYVHMCTSINACMLKHRRKLVDIHTYVCIKPRREANSNFLMAICSCLLTGRQHKHKCKRTSLFLGIFIQRGSDIYPAPRSNKAHNHTHSRITSYVRICKLHTSIDSITSQPTYSYTGAYIHRYYNWLNTHTHYHLSITPR